MPNRYAHISVNGVKVARQSPKFFNSSSKNTLRQKYEIGLYTEGKFVDMEKIIPPEQNQVVNGLLVR